MSSATMIAPKNYAATKSAPNKNYRAGNNKHYDRTRQGVQKTSAYCKVCHDAGRPRHEYTSHFVKDKKGPDGKVVCPLLLNQECRYCHEKGHTPKQCPLIKAKEAKRREYQKQEREYKSRPDADGFRAICSHRHTGRCHYQAKKTRRAAHEALTDQLKPINIFAALHESSSDEEESKTSGNFPTLNDQLAPRVIMPAEPMLTGWATLAAKPPAQTKKTVEDFASKPVAKQTYAECCALTAKSLDVKAPPTVAQDAWDNDSTAAAAEEEELDQRQDEWDEEFKQMKGMSWADMCDSDNEEEED